jgi:hypothetical protein
MKKSYTLFAALLFTLISFSQDLIISEFRVRGPNGPNDEFIEIYNNSDVAHTVASATGTGYAIVASEGVARAVIPNGTVIPARGHWLAVNSIGYSLTTYPAGIGTTATGDATYTTNIPDNAGIALFKTSIAANFTLANRLDAVGSVAEANVLYKEGSGYPSIVPFSSDYCFHRKQVSGRPQDTNDNFADLKFEDTNGISAGAGQSLGAPGPENLTSPINGSGGIVVTYLDEAQPSNVAPNFVRDLSSDPPNSSMYGTIDLRFKITNNTGADITRLRLRITDITTFPEPAGTSDLRARSSTSIVVPTSMGNITVKGTTLEQPSNQPNGGGFNSSMSVGTITLASPLASGSTEYIRVLIGVQQTGIMRAKFIIEALPQGGAGYGGSGGGSSFHFGYYGTDVSAFFNGDIIKEGDLVISEFRFRGSNGVNDEFVELTNTTDHDIIVATSDGSPGWALAGSDGVARFVIPNGTVIKAHGHFLGVNSIGYSLGAYPAGTGATASGDLTYTSDIPENSGIALFITANAANFNLANRLDAVGSVAEANALYKEGTGLPALAPFSIDYSFYRNTNTPNAAPMDSDDNAADFKFEDTNASPAGAGQSLGAPGPQNMSSPTTGTAILVKRASLAAAETEAPNFVRSQVADVLNNSTYGTIALRYCVKNIGLVPVTRLRMRIDSINTFPFQPGFADLRARTSSPVVIAIPSGNVTARATTLEQPPTQPNGGAFNSSISVGSIALGTPLGVGDSIFVNLLFGVQHEGTFTVKFTAEGTPQGGGVNGQTILRATTDPCAGITVNNPATSTGVLGVAFSQSFTSSGGSGTVTYTTASTLPIGLTLASDGTLSGTPGQTGTFPITVNATDANTCTGTSSTYSLVIGCPAVTVDPIVSQILCTGGMTFPVNFSGSPASGVIYEWINNTPSIGLATSGMGNIPAFTAMNAGSSPVTATITVTPTYTYASGTCTGVPTSFTITVAPGATVLCPSNITVSNTPGQCGAVVNYPPATASAGASISYSIPPGSVFAVGTTTVDVTATNGCTTSTCSFTVTVNDTQAPVVNCPANINTTTNPGQCTKVVTFTPLATDNCSGVTVVSNPASGSAFPVGTTVVTVTATDASGNINTCSFTVTVTDSQLPVITTQPKDVAGCVSSDAVFTVTATNAVNYQWQVNTGNGFSNINGATTATLTIPNVSMAMNNYKYRVLVQGLCSQLVSDQANMTVNPLPTVNITASPYTALHPGILTAIYATYDHTPGDFTWYRNNTLLRTTTAPVLANLDIDSLGTYKVVYKDSKGCQATSNEVTLVADPNFQFFVYPTPNSGQFTVRFYTQTLGVKRVLRIMDAKGATVFRQEFVMNSPYHQMPVNLTRNSAGIYYVELHDANGRVLATGSTMVKK